MKSHTPGKWYYSLSGSLVPQGDYDTAEEAEAAGRRRATQGGIGPALLYVGQWRSVVIVAEDRNEKCCGRVNVDMLKPARKKREVH